jgi:hypothetical protein
MTQTINYDSRGCGKGKTTTGIYKHTDRLIKLNQKILHVVSGVELGNQTHAQYPNSNFIHTNNKSQSSVTKEILSNVLTGHNHLIITHQAFTINQDYSLFKDYHLIIDEALTDVTTQVDINLLNYTVVKYDWEQHFELELNVFGDPKIWYSEIGDIHSPKKAFYKLRLKNVSKDSLLAASSAYSKLTNTNRDNYISVFDYQTMTCNMSNKPSFTIHQQLNDNVFKHFKSIYVAAAAFENTEMFYAMIQMGYKLNCLAPFEKHQGNIDLITVSNRSIKWSNNKRKHEDFYLDEFLAKCQPLLNSDPLVLKNKDETKALPMEMSLPHNAHGLNKPEYIASTDIVISSALIPSSDRKFFIKAVLLNGMKEDDKDLLVTNFASAYLFYQIVMRCKLRDINYNNELIQIFVFDKLAAHALSMYFDFSSIRYFDVLSVNKPSTNAENQRRYRQRQKEIAHKKQEDSMRNKISIIYNKELLLKGNKRPKFKVKKRNKYKASIRKTSQLHHFESLNKGDFVLKL